MCDFLIAFDTDDIDVLKNDFFKCEDGLDCVRRSIISDINHIMKSGYKAKKVPNEDDELPTVQEFFKDSFQELFVAKYIYYKEHVIQQQEFEQWCSKLRIDISKVQPLFDGLMELISKYVERYVDPKVDEKAFDNFASEFIEYEDSEEYKNVYNGLMDAMIENIGWKHVLVLAPNPYSDCGELEMYEILGCLEDRDDSEFAVVGCNTWDY